MSDTYLNGLSKLLRDDDPERLVGGSHQVIDSFLTIERIGTSNMQYMCLHVLEMESRGLEAQKAQRDMSEAGYGRRDNK
ncbi:hypothetical protein CEXT_291651 [Caerostris extrusa]|uniref:Uncharacterized protein n=1 Tax=Caerostris extrusa TaxID=172846 RepID=A0AAV4W7C3_CAEEX|nr:hypothetical protein CEXT_291651 [Caerostris extrusa]